MTPEHADSEIPDRDPEVPHLTPEQPRRDVAFRTADLEQELATDATPHPPVRAADTKLAAASNGPSPRPGSPASLGSVSEQAPARLSPVCAVLGGRFELEECVGRGGTADVYRARDLLADQYDREHSTVAVKLLHRELHGDAPLLREILRAAAATRRLRHTAIAQVFEVHQLDGDYLVVTEWLEGESLAKRLDARPHPALGAAELGTVVADIGSALEYAHGHGIVHGDIKPGNVFLTEWGATKLVDFGFRRPPGTPPGDAVARGFTARYATCDVLEGQLPTPQDDVYSLACLIYRVVAGTWPTGNFTALQAEAAGWKPAAPPSLPQAQWRVLSQALVPRRAERSVGIGDLVNAFSAPPAPRAGVAAYGPALALAAGLALLAWQAWTYWQVPARNAPEAITGQIDTPLTAPVELVVELPAEAAVEPVIVPLPPIPAAAPAEVARPPRPPVPSGPATVRIMPAGRVVVSESEPFVRLKVLAVRPRGRIVLSVSARSGSAEVNKDFVPPEPQVVLTPRRPAGEALVSLMGDALPENVEDFAVSFSVVEGNARLAADSVVVLLTDDD